MKAMILAAGRGLRLRPLTDKTPKPLILVDNQPLIVHQVLKLAKIGIKKIVINVSYQAKQIMDALGNGQAYGVKINYSFEPTALETGGGILQALPILGSDPFIVISADIWTDFSLEHLLRHSLNSFVLAHLILVDNPSFHPQGDFNLNKSGLLNLEDTSNKFTFASLGIYHPDLFEGKSGAFPLSSLLYEYIAEKKITGEYYKGVWFNIGTPTELERLDEYLKQKSKPMQYLIISFIGAGNMATSLIKGLLKKNYPAKNIWATNNNVEQLDKLKNLNINLTTDNRLAAQMADIVVLAVKPQMLKAVTSEIADQIQGKNPLVISIAVGINLKTLAIYLSNQPLAIIRCMPNTPALIGCGATALFSNQNCSISQKSAAENIFQSVGITVWLSTEEQIDVVAALSGSGPAYFFLFMEALEEAATELGLSKQMANLLTLKTALGSAQMAIKEEKSLAELRQQVTSPGGTTEQALKFLRNSRFQDIVKKALKEAKSRAEELTKEF